MKKLLTLLGCLALMIALSTPALADDLGQKIANWCWDADPGDTLALTAAESATYDQQTSRGYDPSNGTRFEFENGVGVCTTTYTSNAGDQPLVTTQSVLHKTGDTLVMGKSYDK
ncbi:MAG: hypothetical protein KQH53_10840 [Desulfarculaceae bacterium]|nr:hypothetical protein [Desulfarculaceae bacterium]